MLFPFGISDSAKFSQTGTLTENERRQTPSRKLRIGVSPPAHAGCPTERTQAYKKVSVCLLVLALTAAVSIGTTPAYLTDTDEDVMTPGKIACGWRNYQ